MTAAGFIDRAIELPVVTSVTRLGYEVRRRAERWEPTSSYDLSGRVIVLTGATSGLGRSAAEQLAAMGATLVLVGRSGERNAAVVDEITEATGNETIEQVPADMGDYAQVRDLADAVRASHDRVDVLIHNAGALSTTRTEAPDGTEATVASQVVGPFLLTGLLLEQLKAAAPSRVLTMSSGGMYTANLSIKGLQMDADSYRGAEQYARAKRAQVALTQEWARRFADSGVYFHSLHPGWADTPGVDESLPTFSKIMGPLLRTAEQGADTLVWLAADDTAVHENGLFWLDRRPRSVHKLPSTRASDTGERREQLWDWVVATAGIDPSD